MAHDFNNLLTTMTGFTELALTQVEKDSSLHNDLVQVRRAAMRGANLTRQLLLFSRRQPVEVRPLSITAVVEDLLKMLGRLLGEDVTINVELGQDLPPILGDAGQIEQVVVNLAVNARDAMPEGGEITIRTSHPHVNAEQAEQKIDATAGDFVCLTVSDTGRGIDPAMLPRIFEPFFTTKEAGKGTGLGLAVVYGIVKQHGGWIDVSSEPDVGTTFRVYFPVTTGSPASTVLPSSDIDQPQVKGERILLIEDEEFVRRFATRLLTDQGYRVVAVEDATEALSTFEQEAGEFDLVFSDVILPDGNGLDVVLHLLQQKPALKVLFASGYTDERSKSAIIQKHHFRYLAKPYAVADLLRAIRQVLDNEDSD